MAALLIAVPLLWTRPPSTGPSTASPTDAAAETAATTDQPPSGTDVGDAPRPGSGSQASHPDEAIDPLLDPFGLVTSPARSLTDLPASAGGVSPVGTSVPNAAPVRSDSALAGPDTLADRLLDAALDDGSGESAGEVETEFTTAPLPGVRYLPIPAELEPFARVYAHLLATRRCAQCIVKWQHRESGEIAGLRVMSLEAGRWRSFPITPATGWNTGTYALSVFAADTPSRLIGSSALLVSDNTAAPAPAGPQVEFIQRLIEQGLAVPKTD